MNEEFVTDGLEADRYLKAEKLVYQFQNEIGEAIKDVSSKIIDDHKNLFDEDVKLNYADYGFASGKTLGTIRVEFDMEREHEEHGTLKLNLGLEWVDRDQQDLECVDPEKYDESTSEESTRYVLYKIQRGSAERFDSVRKRTKASDNWEKICFGEDQWPYYAKEAPGIVCIPIESGPEVVECLQILKNHFSEFYAPEFRG